MDSGYKKPGDYAHKKAGRLTGQGRASTKSLDGQPAMGLMRIKSHIQHTIVYKERHHTVNITHSYVYQPSGKSTHVSYQYSHMTSTWWYHRIRGPDFVHVVNLMSG